MADDLIVSGGGWLAVSSDEVLATAVDLDRLIGTAFGLRRVIAGLRDLAPLAASARSPTGNADHGGIAATYLQRAREAEHDAGDTLALAIGQAEILVRGLRLSAAAWGVGERAIERAAQELSARFGFAVGWVLPGLVLMMLPALSALAAGVVLTALATPGGAPALAARAGSWMRENNRVITNPVTVSLLRLAMSSSDDVIGGLVRLPPEIVRVLGDEGTGIAGIESSAAALTVIAARYGVTVESPVAVRATAAARTSTPPQGIADRIERVPEGDAQVRIDRFEQPGAPDRFEVYIGGTIDFSPIATNEPWDMTSNVRGVAGLPAGSIDAVRAAMEDAGITPDTPVVFTGYSQGGLVAARLAASGDYTAAGLVTVGAPAGHVLLPDGMPAIIIEHTDDIVPATGGLQINRAAVVIERELFAGVQVPSDFAVPAHQLAEYRDTARLVDAAGDPRVVGAAAAIGAVTAGAAAGASVSYRAERVQKG